MCLWYPHVGLLKAGALNKLDTFQVDLWCVIRRMLQPFGRLWKLSCMLCWRLSVPVDESRHSEGMLYPQIWLSFRAHFFFVQLEADPVRFPGGTYAFGTFWAGDFSELFDAALLGVESLDDELPDADVEGPILDESHAAGNFELFGAMALSGLLDIDLPDVDALQKFPSSPPGERRVRGDCTPFWTEGMSSLPDADLPDVDSLDDTPLDVEEDLQESTLSTRDESRTGDGGERDAEPGW